DLDQAERFDLGDTLHTRGSDSARGEGSIVEELEEIYDTLRLDDSDSEVAEGLEVEQEEADLGESEPDAAELAQAATDAEVAEVEHHEDLERFIDRVLSMENVSVDDPVRIYLREIGRTALLRSPDESALAERMTLGRKAQLDLAQLEIELKE